MPCPAAARVRAGADGPRGPGRPAAVVGPARARSASPAWHFSDRLYGVAATSATNAWATGLDGNNTLIVHWNGSHWTKEPGSPGFLFRVAATFPTNAWTVGGTNWFQSQTVIEHWDGSAWRQVPSPNPPSGYLNALFSVAPTSAGNAWAVGTTDYAKILGVRWNGHAWS